MRRSYWLKVWRRVVGFVFILLLYLFIYIYIYDASFPVIEIFDIFCCIYNLVWYCYKHFRCKTVFEHMLYIYSLFYSCLLFTNEFQMQEDPISVHWITYKCFGKVHQQVIFKCKQNYIINTLYWMVLQQTDERLLKVINTGDLFSHSGSCWMVHKYCTVQNVAGLSIPCFYNAGLSPGFGPTSTTVCRGFGTSLLVMQ